MEAEALRAEQWGTQVHKGRLPEVEVGSRWKKRVRSWGQRLALKAQCTLRGERA